MDFSAFQHLLKPPALSDIRRALFIQPHPDDNEIGAGGTMARLVHAGAEVFALTVTDDRFCDGPDYSGLETVRQREALAACAALGVQHIAFLGFADKTDASIREISLAILPHIRALRPDAVFSCDPALENECHSDHIKVGYAVRFAVMDATCDFYPPLSGGVRHADTWRVPILGQYYTDRPNTLVDISDFYEQKRMAVRCHASQNPEVLLRMLDFLNEYEREGVYSAVERIKLLRSEHLHCFTPKIGGKF